MMLEWLLGPALVDPFGLPHGRPAPKPIVPVLDRRSACDELRRLYRTPDGLITEELMAARRGGL